MEIDFKIVIAGLCCLTAIYVTLIIYDRDSQAIGTMIVGIIALAIGVIMPNPLKPVIDNKRGVLRW